MPKKRFSPEQIVTLLRQIGPFGKPDTDSGGPEAKARNNTKV
jgi:hypothetical protein